MGTCRSDAGPVRGDGALSAPTLSVRAAREQGAFRVLLDRMARPGTIGQVEPHPSGGESAAVVTLLESLLDHEVSFALLPDDPLLREPLLRYTGSRLYPPEQADFVVARDAVGIQAALQVAKRGELEYPDRSATVVCAVEAVRAEPGIGARLRVTGPGVNGSIELSVAGFDAAARDIFTARNRDVPLGIDLVLVASDGRFTCLTRYTRLGAA
jgi:alpha-D-ribose 1-methylphosphonate 5-triphosphate synthase subunit PhnH